MLGLLTLGLLALTAVVFGSVFGTLAAGGRFVGGELLPADGSFAAIWQAATGGWVADGLGSPAPADPFTTFLFPLALLGGDRSSRRSASWWCCRSWWRDWGPGSRQAG